MDGILLFALAIVLLGGVAVYSFWTADPGDQGGWPSKEELLREKERFLNEMVALERDFKRGRLSPQQYHSRRSFLRQQAAATARRISRYVLMSRESLRMIIETDGDIEGYVPGVN